MSPTYKIFVDNDEVDEVDSHSEMCRLTDWLQRQGINAHAKPVDLNIIYTPDKENT